jgi:hypothetical protein
MLAGSGKSIENAGLPAVGIPGKSNSVTLFHPFESSCGSIKILAASSLCSAILVSSTRTRINPPKGAWASINSSVPATSPTSANFLRPRALGMTFTIRAVAPTGSSAKETSGHFRQSFSPVFLQSLQHELCSADMFWRRLFEYPGKYRTNFIPQRIRIFTAQVTQYRRQPAISLLYLKANFVHKTSVTV